MRLRSRNHPAPLLVLFVLTTACDHGPANQSPDAGQVFASEFPAPSGRPLRIEDYYRVLGVGSPRLSPDGRWVVFEVTLPEESTNRSSSQTWLVRTDGAAPARRVQHDGEDVRSPDWMEDGRLRYSAEGWWILDPDAPSAPAQRAAPSPAGPNISPDGAWEFTLEDQPAGEEGTGGSDRTPPVSDFEARHEARFEGVQFDWLNFQRDGGPFPAPDPSAQPAREIVVTPVEGGSPAGGNAGAGARTLTDLGLRPGGIVWHPDSRRLAFTADPDWKDERRYGRPDIWLATLEGDLQRLTDDGWSYGSLAFSPDGRFLAYTGGYGTDMIIEQALDHGGPRDLFVVSVGEGPSGSPATPVNLTPQWDLDPGRPLWSPDSKYIYFTAEKGGGSHLFRVEAQGGPVEQITHGLRSYDGLDIDDGFTTMVYTVGAFETPPDVYAADLDGSNERRLTDLHADLHQDVTLSRAERLVYPSYDGTLIEGWLLYPYGYDPASGPYPLIVHSHGGPHSASGYGFDFKHQLFAANGYFVLQTNFRSSTGYGEAFKWATWGAWGDKDGEDVMAGIDYAIANFAIDARRVASIGHSYGGFMTNWLISRYPDRFAAAAAGAGIVNWVSDYGTADIARTKETEFFGTPWETDARNRMIRQSPLTYAGQVRAPTLFIHGEEDQRVPYSEAEQMFVALKKNGVPAKVIRYAGQSHGIRGHWNAVHRMINELRWFDRWMGGDER